MKLSLFHIIMKSTSITCEELQYFRWSKWIVEKCSTTNYLLWKLMENCVPHLQRVFLYWILGRSAVVVVSYVWHKWKDRYLSKVTLKSNPSELINVFQFYRSKSKANAIKSSRFETWEKWSKVINDVHTIYFLRNVATIFFDVDWLKMITSWI